MQHIQFGLGGVLVETRELNGSAAFWLFDCRVLPTFPLLLKTKTSPHWLNTSRTPSLKVPEYAMILF